MKLLTALIAILALSGCATWPRETVAEESTFLTLHAIDGMQTANIQNTPHIYEAESAWAIGREPSSQSTTAYFAALAIAHVAVTDFMVCHHVNPWIIRTWELVGIAWDMRDVTTNFSIGLAPTH